MSFSEAIRLPGNLTDWQDTNEGSDRLTIKYKPNDKSEVLFEDNEVDMDFGWSIKSIEEQTAVGRLLEDTEES